MPMSDTYKTSDKLIIQFKETDPDSKEDERKKMK
jgi:hypothetical protein